MTCLNIAFHENHNIAQPRRGLTLMEILATVFVLAFGLMAVLSALPFGAYQLNRMNILDSSGACGRGALAQIRLADWQKPETLNDITAINELVNSSTTDAIPNGDIIADPFIIDPLGLLERSGSPRFEKFALYPATVIYDNLFAFNPFGTNRTDLDKKFVWGDDTIFAQDNASASLRPTKVPSGAAAGDFSWLYMVTPVVSQDTVTRTDVEKAGYTSPENIKEYSVAAVIFNRRDIFQQIRRLKTNYDNPTNTDIINAAGGRITLNSSNPDDLDLSSIKWILLTGRSTRLNQTYTTTKNGALVAQWYRIVGSDEITTQNETNFQRRVFLIGPQWEGANASPVYAVLCDGVVNVYQTTMPK
ncbi:MAG: hypothetical protein LBT05_15085 [Planctomycetaceae bacterium]|jgi:hypothetical protein|nr:hypothetical protein [Planctomycetaceae bacterium]